VGSDRSNLFEAEISRTLWDAKDTRFGRRFAENLNLMDNDIRGRLAEVIVAEACGGVNVGAAYGAWDIELGDGPSPYRVEVKTSGDYQAWKQSSASEISFGCAKKTATEFEGGRHRRIGPAKRHADLYVFARHTGTNPTEPAEWVFYVLHSSALNNAESERLSPLVRVGIKMLETLGAQKCSYDELGEAIHCAKFEAPET
jgi:hypothetical protein